MPVEGVCLREKVVRALRECPASQNRDMGTCANDPGLILLMDKY
jgi:hypothetical protein